MADLESDIIITEDVTAVDDAIAEMPDVDEPVAPGGLEDIDPVLPMRTTFLDYLRSPIVEIVTGDDDTIISAHQALLNASPYFERACAQLENFSHRQMILPGKDLGAMASVIEYLYKGDYFPTLSGNTNLDYDPSVPQPDNDGLGLLRHARVYTLAQEFELPALAALAHKKIHLTQSTAKGEIAYARFVYQETSPEDVNIRKPVATFWATRSHVLRHEAEQEFKRMCLEFPQFGFDVLSLVLDAQEKRNQRSDASGPSASGRKRPRTIL